MALVYSQFGAFRRVLGDLAGRWARTGIDQDAGDHAIRSLVAERLIFLAGAATFIVAPACLLFSGNILPGTYGAAAAIALVFVTVPFLALGMLAITASPWRVVAFVLTVWAALSGAVVSVSPLLAFTCAAVLFLCAAGGRLSHPGGSVDSTSDKMTGPQDSRDEALSLEVTRDGTIRGVSHSASKLLPAGRSFIDHVHVLDRVAVMTAMSDALNDRVACARLSARLDFSGQGQVQSYEPRSVTIVRSSDRLRLSIDRSGEPGIAGGGEEDADAQARQRFLATVSHELRTPLNSIIGFSDILRSEITGALANDQQREYVDLIHSSGNHLLSIVNTILDVSKIDAGTYKIFRDSFDLNGTVGECIAMLEPQARQKSVAVRTDLDVELTEADGDRRAIRQVVINVLSNAIKFTPEGGEVRVSTVRQDDGFAISVSDNGIGMTPEELRRVGKPFIQADNDFTRTCEGTGLGLTVVNGLVALHGGSVDIQSREGNGTRISLTIPDAATIDLPVAGNRNVKDHGAGLRKEDADAVSVAI